MNNKRIVQAGAVMMLTVMLMLSCKESSSSRFKFRQAPKETISYSHADSIIFAAGYAQDYNKMLTLVDSFFNMGYISEVNANRWRGVAYNYLGQTRSSEFYYQKVIKAKISNDHDRLSYIKSARRLSELLVRRGEYEGALKVALPALQQLPDSSEANAKDKAILLSTIGTCQLNTNQKRQALESFEESYLLYEKAMASDVTTRSVNDAVNSLDGIIRSLLYADAFIEAEPWIVRMDTLVALLSVEETNPTNTAIVNKHKADVLLYKAGYLQGTNQTALASKAYQEFQQTDYGKTAQGKIASNEYLMHAKRFSEAATNYSKLDEVLADQGTEMNLDNIHNYLIPKLKANVEAGRRDSVVHMAINMCDVVDSAIIKNKSDESAELAVIYGTEQKETEIANQKAKIAESEADLSNQRLITLGVVITLMLVFFTIFTIKRRQHEKQLQLANTKLEAANDQLEIKNKDLTIAREKAEEASKMKTNFIMQISHEIRTPLNAVCGFSQVITMPGMEFGEEELAEINNGIVENTERITGLVNKMLELSDVANDSGIEKTDQVTAKDIADAAVLKSGIDKASHLHFQLFVDHDLISRTFASNLEQATRALSLLLDNAMKFTHPAEAAVKVAGGIEKMESASLQVTPNGDDKVDFIISDTGIGVPPEESEHIFEEFVQLDDYYDGTGIGLTLARSIARRLGGDIVLDTTYSPGARFVFTLPLEEKA